RVRPALAVLDRELGLTHALASQRLYTDGAEVLFDYADGGADSDTADAIWDLVVVRHGQRVFTEVVQSWLRRVTFRDDYAQALPLPGYDRARVIVDAGRSFGQPIFDHGRARLEDVLGMFRAGEPLDVVAAEYAVPLDELEEAVRVSLRRVA
ncbi:MAG TPA: DUF433 domain-containing protein, partial [Candidatus Lustribacter sp.]|nr:DUF433 domain-containing protein [Candidatus Lustribacter sp.]